jgi:hypothetical protein
MFSTESMKSNNKDNPKFLDKIFTGKPINVQSKFVNKILILVDCRRGKSE